MAGEKNYKDESEYFALSKFMDTIKENIDNAVDYSENLQTSVDKRVVDYYTDKFSSIKAAKDTLAGNNVAIAEASEWMDGVAKDLTRANETTRALSERLVGDDPTAGDGLTTPNLKTPEQDNDFKFDPDAWDKLPPELQEKIKKSLENIGLSPEEIEKIIKGEISVNEFTLDAITDELADLLKHDDAYIAKLEDLLGFSIRDENGEIDKNLLAMAVITAGKNLGMDIDLKPGTPFKKYLNNLSLDLQSQYRKDPGIRQLILDKYGIDIFDENGKVDPEKLALVKIIDGLDLNDDYDLEKLLEGLKGTTDLPVGDESTTGVVIPKPGDVIPKPGVVIPKPGDPDTKPSTPTPQERKEIGTSGVRKSGGIYPSVPPVKDTKTPTVTPVGGGLTSEKPSGSSTTAGGQTVAAALKDGIEGVGSGILDAIGKGAAKLAKGISPYTGGMGGNGAVNVNKATAGIIAAASVAAGGAAAGGGILAAKKASTTKFTPEDWASLGEDYQGIIEKVMKKVGFTEDEIETFKNSKFKIATSELKEHIKKIDKAVDANPTCDDELLRLYEYSMFDENLKVNDYLLFITMIIDGKNAIDDYNMYNVINQSFGDVDEADFIYAGIAMEDYFDVTIEEEEAELKILNDPTTKAPQEEAATSTSQDDLDEFGPGIDKEWLKGIGIDE